MCLMLYIATQSHQPLRTSPHLGVEEVEGSHEAAGPY